MGSKSTRNEQSFTLTAAIERIERSYFICEHRNLRRVDDEAILTVHGVIEHISPRYKRHAGGPIEMQFICARSFDRDKAVAAAEKPFLLSVNLRGESRSLLAYLPSDAFWALPEMISSKAATHVEAEFGPSRGGHADLQFLHFTNVPASGQ